MNPSRRESLIERRAEQRRRLARVRRRNAILVRLGAFVACAVVVLAAEGGGGIHPSLGVGNARPARQHGGPSLPPIAPARPGVAGVFKQGAPLPEVALTFDDGFCATCARQIIATLRRTGAHATIFPNGTYGRSWEPLAPEVRNLLARGQLLIGNHTFTHHDPLRETPAALQDDLVLNEQWIESTFGVTARPFFRPPYGSYNQDTVTTAGRLGYTDVVNWSGSLADTTPRSVAYILAAIREWAKPGAIILGHANYPATAAALPQILKYLHEKHLRPVTLAELLMPGR